MAKSIAIIKAFECEQTHWIHLKVDELSACESDDDLPAVDGTSDDGLLARRLPLVDSLVLANVTDALRIYLWEIIFKDF